MQTLETERLILREWKDEDARDVYEYASGDKVGPMAGWKPHENPEETLRLIRAFREEDETWALELKATGKVVGSIGLHASRKAALDLPYDRELGYVLAESCWGKGLMPEAAARAIGFAFEELGVRTLIVSCFPFNFRSRRVIEKSGFRFVRLLKDSWLRYDGALLSEYVYEMTAKDYKELVNIPRQRY